MASPSSEAHSLVPARSKATRGWEAARQAPWAVLLWPRTSVQGFPALLLTHSLPAPWGRLRSSSENLRARVHYIHITLSRSRFLCVSVMLPGEVGVWMGGPVDYAHCCDWAHPICGDTGHSTMQGRRVGPFPLRAGVSAATSSHLPWPLLHSCWLPWGLSPLFSDENYTTGFPGSATCTPREKSFLGLLTFTAHQILPNKTYWQSFTKALHEAAISLPG